MWPGIIKYTRTRVGHVARYHYKVGHVAQVSLHIQELELVK